MDPWQDRVNQSTALSEARELRKQISEVTKSKQSPEDQPYLDRIELVTSMVIARLEGTDPGLVGEPVLSSLGSSLANLRSYFSSWGSSADATYLRVHAQNMIDSILATLGQLPALDLPGTREAVSQMRRAVSGYRLNLDQQVKSTTDELSTVTDSVGELRKDLEKTETTISELQSQQQTAFSKAETERTEAFNRLLTRSEKDLTGSLNNLGTEASNFVTNTKSRIAANEKAAKDAKARIEKILGIVSEEALIGKYSKSADQERHAADLWRWITVGAIGLAILAAGWLAWATSKNSVTWHEVVAKLVLTLAFSGLAGYAGRQSGEHRDAQRDAEQMALQLAALKPYLSDLADGKKRDELLTTLGDRLFGNLHAAGKEQELKLSKKDDPTLVGQLLGLVQELVKAKNT